MPLIGKTRKTNLCFLLCFSPVLPRAVGAGRNRRKNHSILSFMEKITIKDIARLAGVSVATVSYIINGVHEDRYTTATKKKVLQIINLYNYRPSQLARAFTSSKTNNVILLTDKHDSVLQKAESYDFLRLLGKSLEKSGLNLLMRTHLEDARVDTAEAIICAGMDEGKFRRLAQENFVPLLSVDGKINDQLFFQIYQDFAAVSAAGEREFGRGNFSLVLVDMYNDTLKEEISAQCKGVVFIETCDEVPEGNIVTVNSSLKGLKRFDDRNILLVPANTQARVEAILDCLGKATERTEVSTHTVLVK